LGADLASDAFGAELLNAGVSASTIKSWGVDPQVSVNTSGKKGSLFDSLEDINADECIARCVDLVSYSKPKNQAFVFVKPHAVNGNVVELVTVFFCFVCLLLVTGNENTSSCDVRSQLFELALFLGMAEK
jgi:hypothetical protein